MMQDANKVSDAEVFELEPQREQVPVIQQGGAIALSAGESFMMMLRDKGASLDEVARMMDLKDRMDAKAAEQAWNEAFSAFKNEAISIVKNTRTNNGPLEGRMYADKFAVVNAVTPHLSKHGLSSTWKRTKDDKDWIEVTCYVRHVRGHVESTSMGGPPDAGGAKNAIQARQSTESYLQRYTLLAILGMAEGGDDDDGNGGSAGNQNSLLNEGQAAAMNGMQTLTAWWAGLTAKNRSAMQKDYPAMRRAASAADGDNRG